MEGKTIKLRVLVPCLLVTFSIAITDFKNSLILTLKKNPDTLDIFFCLQEMSVKQIEFLIFFRFTHS